MTTWYSDNWCGGRLKSKLQTPVRFTMVSATWTVPSLTRGTGGAGPWYLTSLIGLDGGSKLSHYHRDIILQAGVTSMVDGGGATYRTFYGWSPGNLQYPNLQIHPGDGVAVTITVQSNRSASINFAVNGQPNNFDVHNPHGPPFRGETLAWVIERNAPDDADAPGPRDLAAFTSIDFPNGMSFQNAVGKTNGGTDVSPTDGDLLWMEATPYQNGPIPIATAAINGGTIEITHV